MIAVGRTYFAQYALGFFTPSCVVENKVHCFGRNKITSFTWEPLKSARCVIHFSVSFRQVALSKFHRPRPFPSPNYAVPSRKMLHRTRGWFTGFVLKYIIVSGPLVFVRGPLYRAAPRRDLILPEFFCPSNMRTLIAAFSFTVLRSASRKLFFLILVFLF